jgi:hypothetical protein
LSFFDAVIDSCKFENCIVACLYQIFNTIFSACISKALIKRIVSYLGVFVGCQYVNAQGQVIHSQYYPSGTTGVVQAYIVDDPDVLFQAQLDGTTTIASLGENTFFAAAQSTTTGSTATGNSTSALDATTVSTTAAFRVVGFVSPVGDAFPDVLVKFNPGYHSMTNAVGHA